MRCACYSDSVLGCCMTRKTKKYHLQNCKWHFDTQVTMRAFVSGSDTLYLHYNITTVIRQCRPQKKHLSGRGKKYSTLIQHPCFIASCFCPIPSSWVTRGTGNCCASPCASRYKAKLLKELQKKLVAQIILKPNACPGPKRRGLFLAAGMPYKERRVRVILGTLFLLNIR